MVNGLHAVKELTYFQGNSTKAGLKISIEIVVFFTFHFVFPAGICLCSYLFLQLFVFCKAGFVPSSKQHFLRAAAASMHQRQTPYKRGKTALAGFLILSQAS